MLFYNKLITNTATTLLDPILTNGIKPFYSYAINRVLPDYIKIKTARHGRNQDRLKIEISHIIRYPEIFPEGYDEIVPFDRWPTVLKLDNNSTIPFANAVKVNVNNKYDLLLVCPATYPSLKYKGDLPICTNPNWVNQFNKNININKGEITPRFTGSRSFIRTPVPTPTYRSPGGQVTPTRGKVTGILNISGANDEGPINPNTAQLLAQAYEIDKDTNYVRIASWYGPNSVIYCILNAINDPILQSLQIDNYYPYLSKVRSLIATSIHPEVCKQELYYLSLPTITKQLGDDDIALDTKFFYRALEEFFQVNLMIWFHDDNEQNRNKGEQQRAGYDLEIPSHILFSQRQIALNRPTIILFKQNVPQAPSLSPHYELIAQRHAREGLQKVLGHQWRNNYKIYITKNKLFGYTMVLKF